MTENTTIRSQQGGARPLLDARFQSHDIAVYSTEHPNFTALNGTKAPHASENVVQACERTGVA
jgi:hypothetical protein